MKKVVVPGAASHGVSTVIVVPVFEEMRRN